MEKINLQVPEENQVIAFDNGVILTEKMIRHLYFLQIGDESQTFIEMNCKMVNDVSDVIIDLSEGKAVSDKQVLDSLSSLRDVKRDYEKFNLPFIPENHL